MTDIPTPPRRPLRARTGALPRRAISSRAVPGRAVSWPAAPARAVSRCAAPQIDRGPRTAPTPATPASCATGIAASGAAVGAAALAALATPVHAGPLPGPVPIYDAVTTDTDGVAFFGDLVLDDLQVSGGGLLETITVRLTAQGIGGTVLTDVMCALALDGGDGIPDFDGTGDDVFLVQTMLPGVVVPVGGVVEVPIDVSQSWSTVPADALLFGGLQFTNQAVGHLFTGAPSPGSTSPIVFSFAGMGPVPVPSETDPGLVNSDALAFRLDATTLPPGTPARAIDGEVIDFDDQLEGLAGPVVALGGATFSGGRDGFPPPIDLPFAFDDGTGLWDANPGMLDFVGGTLLNLGAWSDGPDGYVFSALKTLRIAPDQVRTGARVGVAYVAGLNDPPESYADATITLLALNGGVPVASDTINGDNVQGTSGGGSFDFGAGTLQVSGVAFDELRIFSNGGPALGAMQMGIDNVLLGEASCLGDLDGDGTVGFGDLVSLLSAYGVCSDPLCLADLNGDGVVAFDDLVALLSAWGPCGG